MVEAEEKFKDDHREEIENYEKWIAEKEAKENEEYGDELDDDENENPLDKEPPTLPEFVAEEYLEKFDEDNPEIYIPDEVVDDIDNDWPMTEDEEAELIAQYWA